MLALLVSLKSNLIT